MIYKFWGVAVVETLQNATEFGERVANLYRTFDAPSMIGTCSLVADNETDARKKAIETFRADGWTIEDGD